MARVHIDCREFPSEMNCTLALVADSEEELLEAAVQHAVVIHKHKDSRGISHRATQDFQARQPAP